MSQALRPLHLSDLLAERMTRTRALRLSLLASVAAVVGGLAVWFGWPEDWS